MTVGLLQQFEYGVVYFPEAADKGAPGLELVTVTRAMEPRDFAIGNTNITERELNRIGTGPIYVARRTFMESIITRANLSEQRIDAEITKLDQHDGVKTFQGGCDYLLAWYRNKVVELSANNYYQIHLMQRANSTFT